jgi:uncharacterized cupin superfamily protein
VYGENEYLMKPGECFGFRHGNGKAHQLINKSENEVVYSEIGDRSFGDEVQYPADNLRAELQEDGAWLFLHKDGTQY